MQSVVDAVRLKAPRPDRFLNRDLSWLEFDGRILELAADPGVPLLERVKFLAIAASNLDEFFSLRIAALLEQVQSGVSTATPDGRLPSETLADCRDRAVELEASEAALWLEVLRPALAAARIRVVAIDDCGPRELATLAKRFRAEIEPLLTPIAVGAIASFPCIPSLMLYIGAAVRDPNRGSSRFVRVNVPTSLPRFVALGRGAFVFLEDAIDHFLPSALGDAEIMTSAVFRVTRNDLSATRDEDALIDAGVRQLAQGSVARTTRLEVATGASPTVVDFLRDELGVSREQVYSSDAPLGLAGLRELARLDRPELKNPQWPPVTRGVLARRSPASLLTQIRRRDILVHHPYDSFDSSIGTFTAAAPSPKVDALKVTMHNGDDESPMVAALVTLAEAEKESVCLVEDDRDFDARSSSGWRHVLERAGVDVVFSEPGLTVHAKLTMLARRERGITRRYAHIGTGSYPGSHACSYEDLGLLTADEAITHDVADVFNAVSGRARPAAFRKLLVGPWFLRDGIMREIETTAAAARTGQKARIRIKVNSLVDPEIVDALVGASMSGATVEVVTRGICVLRPGVAVHSQRITVRSVLGRFLEHSRIFWFQAGERLSVWIGSADLTPRDLDHCIAVLAPIEDSTLRAEIGVVFDALLADTRFSWELQPDGTWVRTSPEPGERPVSTQDTLMQRAVRQTKTG